MIFETKRPDEFIPVTFPYDTEIGAAAISGAVITVTVIQGTDASPATMLQGAAQVTGAVVVQLIKGGVDNARYRVRCLATFDDGKKLGREYLLEVQA